MSYVCKTLSPEGVCVEWAQGFVLPSLTAEQGTELAGMIVPVLIIAAALRIVRDFIAGSQNKG